MPKTAKFSIILMCLFLAGSPSSILDIMLGVVSSCLMEEKILESIFSEKSLKSEISCAPSFGSSFLEEMLAEHWAQYLILDLVVLLAIRFLTLTMAVSSYCSTAILRLFSC